MITRPVSTQLTSQAQRDLAELYAYLLDEAGQTIANRMQDAINSTIHLLCCTDTSGRHCAFPQKASSNVQSIAVSAPFGHWLLFFTQTPSHIRVERVLHSGQSWSSLSP